MAHHVPEPRTTRRPTSKEPGAKHRVDTRNAAAWAVAGLAALVFLFTGGMKLLGMSTGMFEAWGYPGWFSYVIGLVEVTGAILLLVPKTTFYGGALLLADMVGAFVTHVMHGEWLAMFAPVLMMVLVGLTMYLRRPAGLRQKMPRRRSSPSRQ